MKAKGIIQGIVRLVMIGMAILLLSVPVQAYTTFDLVGANDANLLANVIFHYDPATATVSVDIENVSVNEPDPRLTAFAFNLPGNVTGISGFTAPAGWDSAFDPDKIDTPEQIGTFDAAGETGPNFNGGQPNEGVPVGSNYQFTFTLAGTNLDLLSDESFLSLVSETGNNQNQEPQFFVGRFQRTGADGEGSDVAVPGQVSVPEPLTLVLLGTGFVGFALFALFRRKFKS